jgi:hypothetical protein
MSAMAAKKRILEAVNADSLERIDAHFQRKRTIVKLVLRGIDHRGGGEHGGGEKSMTGGKVRVKGGKEKRPIDAEGASGAAAPFERNGDASPQASHFRGGLPSRSREAHRLEPHLLFENGAWPSRPCAAM